MTLQQGISKSYPPCHTYQLLSPNSNLQPFCRQSSRYAPANLLQITIPYPHRCWHYCRILYWVQQETTLARLLQTPSAPAQVYMPSPLLFRKQMGKNNLDMAPASQTHVKFNVNVYPCRELSAWRKPSIKWWYQVCMKQFELFFSAQRPLKQETKKKRLQ